VQNKLNLANYVVKRGRSKPIVIHIDRLRKLPVEMEADSDDRSMHDGALACPPAVTRRSDTTVAAAASPYPVSDVSRPSTRYAGRYRAVGLGACPPGAGPTAVDAYPPVPASQSTDTAIVTATASTESTADLDRPRPVPTTRPAHTRHCPARFLESVQARRLTTPSFAAHAGHGVTGSDVNVTHGSQSESAIVNERACCSISVGCRSLL